MQQYNSNSFNQPLQKIAELNKEAFEKFSYLKAEDFQTTNPPVLVEKSVQIFIDNSHKSLDYMHQLFNILGNSWEKLSQEAREKTQDVMKKSQSYASSVSKEISNSSAHRASTKSTSPLRKKTSRSNSNKSQNAPSRSAAPHTASSDKKG